MAEQLHTLSSKTPSNFLHWTLFVFTALLGIELGAGLFTTVVAFPVWASSPEAAIGFRPETPYYFEEGSFFMFSSITTNLFAIITLIAGWRAEPKLRKWLMVASVAFLIVAVWSAIYFIPIQDTTFKGEEGTKVPRDELASMLQNFVWLNYIRQVLIVLSLICGLHALGLSYRLRKP